MIKLKDILGLTNYLFSKANFSSYDKFKLQRYFVDNFRVTKSNLDFRTQPTWQNFKHDELLANAKANGIKNIWCTQGAFDWQGVQGKQGKVMPIRDGDNALSPQSWKDIGDLCRQVAIRYANDTSHLLAEAKVFQGEPAYLSNTPKAGLDLLEAIEIQNEWDFKKEWSGATRTITPEEYAVCFKVCYDAIRSVSQTMKVIMGGGISPVMSTFDRFLGKLDSLYQAEGKQTPNDFYLCFHWYMRNGSQDQGGGTAGISPEEARAHEFGQSLDNLCEQRGLPGWYCTETGWATDTSKQSAPIQEGFTREQSQGLLMIRLALIWGASQYCKGITFWHVRDDYDQPPYAKGGVNYKDWSAKPARTLCEYFLNTYGEYDVVDFFTRNGIFYAIMNTETDPIALMWTDKKPIGEASPMPKQTIITTEPTMNLKVVNKQLQWSDGQPCNLIHADSPESRLHPNYKAAFSAECKALPTKGINSITVTMRGDDVTAITPWINNTPSQGVDTAKLQTWHDQLKEFLIECEKNGLRGVVIAYLGERTNFKSITDAQYFAWIDAMEPIFQDISGSMIFGWEEIWDGSNSATMAFAGRVGTYLKSKLPNCLLMVHNNPGQKPWQSVSTMVDLICIQETSVSAMKASAVDALARDYAVHFHELYPGFKLSNSQDTNKALMKQLCDAAMSIGCKNVGCFSSDYDLQSPDANKLGYLYTYQSQLLTGTIPNPTPMKIQYTTANNHPANAPELTEGTSIIPGNYSVFTDVAGTFDLYKNNVRQPGFPKVEGVAPFDMWGTTGTSANLYPFTEGSWRLVFTPKTGAAVTVNFTVGTVTPPPPPTQKEPILEEYIENGTHYVARTASGTYKAAVTKI